MKQVLGKDGQWVDGGAAPRLLPEHLRVLPGDVVATDIDDPDRAHELDAPHIVRSLKKEHEKQAEPEKKTAKGELGKLRAPGVGERAPVTQWFVDVAKMRVIKVLVDKAMGEVARGLSPNIESQFYLWFPANNVNRYELRKGAPPLDRERPRWMRGIDLRVDMLSPPKSIVRELKARGVDLEVDLKERLKIAEWRRNVLLA